MVLINMDALDDVGLAVLALIGNLVEQVNQNRRTKQRHCCAYPCRVNVQKIRELIGLPCRAHKVYGLIKDTGSHSDEDADNNRHQVTDEDGEETTHRIEMIK